ncbi:MAG: hypothetical protein HY238_13655 [Acidobacteria bacterium]|nr:hypothetical protein [Acidobacteriota bacterium]
MLNHVAADDLIYTDHLGEVMNKTQYIRNNTPTDLTLDVWNSDDLNVRLYGDVA